MAGGLKIRTGHHQVGADRHARVGQPPGVGVEHRHHRQDRVGLAGTDAVCGGHRDGVQPGRAVRVHHALGVARRAARVAHRRGLVLVEARPLDRRRGREQVLVVVQLGRPGLGRLVAATVVGHHHVADGLERLEQGPQQPGQGPVDEDDLVLGVVHDVGDLLGEEPDVECVQHPTRARCGEVELQVAGGVPTEGGDAPVCGDAQLVEHPAEAPGPVGPLAVGLALDATGRRRDHVLLGEQGLGSIEEVVEGERSVLHEPLHGVPLCPRASKRYLPAVRRTVSSRSISPV